MTKSSESILSTHWAPWSTIAEDLVSLKAENTRVLFIANPGNAGDAIIASATWQFFDDIGLKPTLSHANDIRPGDVVIYGGGGNLVPMYTDAKNVLDAALRQGVSRFILLPHTVRGHEEVLTRLDVRFRLYGRDIVTLEHLRRCAPNASLALAPDMALGMDVERVRRHVEEDLPPWWLWRWAGFRVRRWKAYRRWLRESNLIQPDVNGLLDVRRSDQEAADIKGSPGRDLSCLYNSSLNNRDECDAVSGQFLAVIDRASHISTDRLHVAIGGHLLGKSVRLLDNSYGKNHAVAKTFPLLMGNVSLSKSSPISND